ncbi:MAG: PAS domain S-box protein [Ignavibacteria bacterium]|nr:PAS domain S-box protein [Ignavibacteria bacterium]
MKLQNKNKLGSSALLITFAYFAFGVIWIAVSGEIVNYFTKGSDLGPRFELYKGLFFILITSILLYLAIHRREKQREKLEENISASEKKWKDIFDCANDPIFLLDRNYRIMEANSKACKLYGYTEAEFRQLSIKDLNENNSEDIIKHQMEDVISSRGAEFEVTHKSKTGMLIPVEVSTQALLNNDIVEYIHIVHDLSARKNIEQKLNSSESKYRTLVEASHEMIWTTDADEIVTFVNEASFNIYGYTPAEMIGRKFSDFCKGDYINTDKQTIENAKRDGNGIIEYESRIKDSNGREKYLFTKCIIVKNPEGNPAGMLGTSLDITERFEAVERVKYHNRVYSLMTNMNQLIVRASDKNSILNDACRLAVEYGMFRMAWIGVVDETTGNVKPQYSFGDTTNYLESITISVKEPENIRGPIVRSFTDKLYYVSNDVENDVMLSKWKEHTLDKGFRAFACFPIEVKDKVVAVYNIYSDKKGFFGKTETDLLLELIEDISFALEYIELEQEREIIEGRYKNIVEKAPIGIYSHIDERITYINPEGQRIFGVTSEKELIGKNIFDLIHPDFKDIVTKRLTNYIEKGIVAPEVEETYLKIDGSAVDVMVSAIPYSVNGRSGAQVFFKDLTEQRRTQRAIIESNERFDLISKATNDTIWDWDLKTDELWWNESFKDTFGYRDEEIERGINSWLKRIHQHDRERIETGIRNAINSGHDFWFDEYSFLKKGGDYAFVFDRGYILKDQYGKPYRMIGSIIDITYRKRMENELKQSEEKWRSLFENSPSLIFTLDKDLKITSINRSLIKRAETEDFIGRDSLELVHESERAKVAEIINRVFDKAEAENFIVRGSESQSKHYYSVQAIPQISDNTAAGVTIFATDITEKINSDEKIKETNQRLHALAAHLQTIREEERTKISREIHDQLGQELTALKMDIAFMSRKIDKTKVTGKADWDELNAGLKSMSDITDQTINSVRRIARELRPDVLDKLGLKEAIEWQAEEFTKRTGIDCIVSITASELQFDNLLENTIFRIVQESLTNVARHSNATRSKIGFFISQDEVSLSIEDNGRGITQDEIDNAKSLGLVGIKERVYSVNGTLSIKGTKDKGTILKITIPLKKNE